MRDLSIRLRLTLWYALVLFIGLGLLVLGIWFTLEKRLLGDIDVELAQRVEGLKTVTLIEGENATPLFLAEELHEFTREIPNGPLMEVRDRAGHSLLPREGPPLFPPDIWEPLGFRTIQRSGRTLRVLTQTYADRGETYTAAVAVPLTGLYAVMRELRNLLIATIPGVFLIACLGGYWISRRALAPVDEITRVARSISAQNLSSRLEVANTGDELQRMSEAWNDVLSRLESALERIRQFTADASHELRTPMALIRTTAELALRRDRDASAYRAALRDIQGHIERMSELTDALLALARADAVGVEMPLVSADLNHLVLETVEQVATLAENQGINLTVGALDRPAVAHLNEAGIRRVLLILIDNALKYTPANGCITVSVTEIADGLQLAVSDSGSGIDDAVLPHIFERFYRADAARTGNTGVGLGLPIAQMIARAHGTSVEVDSIPGSGSTFRIRFQP